MTAGDMPRELSELLSEMGQTDPMPPPPERLARVALRLEKTLAIPRIDVPLRDEIENAERAVRRGGRVEAANTSSAPSTYARQPASLPPLRTFLQHRGVIALGMYLSGALTTLAVREQLGKHQEGVSVVSRTPAPSGERATASAPIEPWVTPASPEPRPSAAAAPTPAAVVVAPSASSHRAVSKLADERQLILVARAGLARGRPKEALAALDEHARRFAAGELAEEREGLRVEALVASGSYEDAKAVAERFDAKFPDSMLRGSVRHALQSIP
jgi:hypothetical protein